MAACLPPFGELRARPGLLLWPLLSVLLLRLCHPPLALWPLGFVALVPWLWSLRGTTPRVAFWSSWLFGSLHFFTVFAWLAVLRQFNPFIFLGIPLVALFQGFFIGVSGAGMVFFGKRMALTPAFLLSIAWWCGWEWFRSVGALGLPYALLGHSVRSFLALTQITSLGGVVLLSGLVLAVNLCVMEATVCLIRRIADPLAMVRWAVVGGVLVAAVIWGSAVRSATARAEAAGIPLRVALLQPNVPQSEKFASYADPDAAVREELQTRQAVRLFGMLDALEPGAHDLIVTPESALTQPFFDLDMEEDLQREVRERANLLRAPLIVSAADNVFRRADGSRTERLDDAVGEGGFYDYNSYNALYLVRPGETELLRKGDYRKIQLMPFGETLPYFDLIPGLQEKIVQIGSFLRGDRNQPPLWITLPADATRADSEPIAVHLGPTICFEDMFPPLHNRLARRGVHLFVNITNNAWFDPSLGSVFHFEYARLRCAETRRPMVLCTNSGVTAVISGTGEILERLPLREEGVLSTTVQVPAEPSPTLYARLGDWFGLLAFLSSWAVLVLLWRRRTADPRADAPEAASNVPASTPG
ncbi:MAG: apolipoprotein N-acyltransferase [Candidatus Sumerlaeota bacterium]|nr:apolipoprotein N-acyltransferase [Candidatus Sumerlaeota bacterium]